jgi:hypothetical protein
MVSFGYIKRLFVGIYISGNKHAYVLLAHLRDVCNKPGLKQQTCIYTKLYTGPVVCMFFREGIDGFSI